MFGADQGYGSAADEWGVLVLGTLFMTLVFCAVSVFVGWTVLKFVGIAKYYPWERAAWEDKR